MGIEDGEDIMEPAAVDEGPGHEGEEWDLVDLLMGLGRKVGEMGLAYVKRGDT